MTTSRDVKSVAHAIKAEPPVVHYRQGTVVDLNPLTITMGGSDVPIPGVPAVGSYAPVIGDSVHVLRYADTALVLGTSL